MKKIINGKLYYTETAKKIAGISYGHPGDFSYFEESLYKKKTGEFFLYGEGGALSQYAKITGPREKRGSSEIISLTLEAAKSWMEENCKASDYIETLLL